jgi:hypothetical protein
MRQHHLFSAPNMPRYPNTEGVEACQAARSLIGNTLIGS